MPRSSLRLYDSTSNEYKAVAEDRCTLWVSMSGQEQVTLIARQQGLHALDRPTEQVWLTFQQVHRLVSTPFGFRRPAQYLILVTCTKLTDAKMSTDECGQDSEARPAHDRGPLDKILFPGRGPVGTPSKLCGGGSLIVHLFQAIACLTIFKSFRRFVRTKIADDT